MFLDKLAEIKVCIAYQLNGKRMDFPEMLTCDWEKLEPVYETFPGWLESTEDVSSYEKLPLKSYCIFGSNRTPLQLSDLFDILWASKRENYI